MRRFLSAGLAIAATLAAAACNRDTTSLDANAFNTGLLGAAFASLPGGFTATNNSFAGVEGDPSMLGREFGRHGGRGGHGPGPGGLMGGGLEGLFLGRGFGDHRGGFGLLLSSCAFDNATRRVTCPDETRNGLTIQRSYAFADASGSAQQAWDSVTTDRINARVAVSGTVVRRDSSVSVVSHASERTVTGLAAGSVQRTVNGASAGQETTTGTNDTGSFTLVRVVGDTIEGVTVPASGPTSGPPYPTAGTVTRSMQATLSYAGGTTTTSTRREVVTYDGSDTATLVITIDGVTKTCSLPLPRGRPTCES